MASKYQSETDGPAPVGLVNDWHAGFVFPGGLNPESTKQ